MSRTTREERALRRSMVLASTLVALVLVGVEAGP